MSYSFSAQGATKADAIAAAEARLKEVVNGQPIHAKDAEQALAGVAAFVQVLQDPTPEQMISISCYGSLGWQGSGDEQQITSANFNVSASLITKA